jgi:hypothetical protein
MFQDSCQGAFIEFSFGRRANNALKSRGYFLAKGPGVKEN